VLLQGDVGRSLRVRRGRWAERLKSLLRWREAGESSEAAALAAGETSQRFQRSGARLQLNANRLFVTPAI